jgi:hypothetical protein
VRAIVDEDVEVKAAVTQFVNNMVIGLDEVQDRWGYNKFSSKCCCSYPDALFLVFYTDRSCDAS